MQNIRPCILSRTVFNDNVSAFQKLLEKDNSVIIHARNLKLLATEPYKTERIQLLR